MLKLVQRLLNQEQFLKDVVEVEENSLGGVLNMGCK